MARIVFVGGAVLDVRSSVLAAQRIVESAMRTGKESVPMLVAGDDEPRRVYHRQIAYIAPSPEPTGEAGDCVRLGATTR